MNDYIKGLVDLHIEMGNLIKELNKVEDGSDGADDFYEGVLRDYHWDNVMLSNRLRKLKKEWG